MPKGYSYRKQTLSTDYNGRDTEICHRRGSVRGADARWLLRCASWDKEFTLSAFRLQYLIGGNRARQSRASLKGCHGFSRPDLPQEPSMLVAGLACFQHPLGSGRDFQPLSRPCLPRATVPDTTQSCPQQWNICCSLDVNFTCLTIRKPVGI